MAEQNEEKHVYLSIDEDMWKQFSALFGVDCEEKT